MPNFELIGQTIGNYRIESVVGTGGMGRVYRAVHLHLGRAVAIKVMHAHYAADPRFQARFLQEAKAATDLHHPNIVEVYDFGEQDDLFYLVMELATDGSLRTLLSDRASAQEPVSLALGIDLIQQAAEGLAHAHRRGMVHRDVKPDNLLLSLDPDHAQQPLRVKIADFGLARLAEGNVTTVSGMAMGTPAYMSPEQCQGEPVDGRSDMYSLGVVLYEVTTGQLPFQTQSVSDAVFKHVYTAPRPPRRAQPDLPERLEEVILRCLAKQPDERFATMDALVDELAQLGAALPEMTFRPAPLTESSAATVHVLHDTDPVIPAAAHAHARPGRLEVVLYASRVELVPGRSTPLLCSVSNQDRLDDEVSVQVEGVPPSWLAESETTIALGPASRRDLMFNVQPPVDALAQELVATIRARSSRFPERNASAEAHLVALPPGARTPVPAAEAMPRRPAWMLPVAGVGIATVLALACVGLSSLFALPGLGGNDAGQGTATVSVTATTLIGGVATAVEPPTPEVPTATTVAVAAPTSTPEPPAPTATESPPTTTVPEPTATIPEPTATSEPEPTPTPEPTATVPEPTATEAPPDSTGAVLLSEFTPDASPEEDLDDGDFAGYYDRNGSCYTRQSMLLYGQGSGVDTASTEFDADDVDGDSVIFAITGLDDESGQHERLRVILNGQTIWEGDPGFANAPEPGSCRGPADWRTIALQLDNTSLLQEENLLQIQNIEPNGEIGRPPWILIEVVAIYYE